MLKLYMGYDNDPQEGAVLIFAHTAREARKLAYPYCLDWFQSEWINVRATLLKGKEHLRSEADQKKLAADIPHVIDSPKSCDGCNQWGNEIDAEGICTECREEENFWKEDEDIGSSAANRIIREKTE